MPGYNGRNYSLTYALENIGDYFWRIYRDDLLAYAKDPSRKDIIERIHQEWNGQTGCKKSGTDIRIEWAVQIYNHGDWEKSLTTPVPDYKATTSQDCITDPRRKYTPEYRCDILLISWWKQTQSKRVCPRSS